MSSPRPTQAMADYLVEDVEDGAWISPAGYEPSRRRLVAAVDNYPGQPDRIADVGCGAGELSAALGDATDATVVAVDISPASCRAARNRTDQYGNVEVVCADANRPPLHGEQFDIIYAANSVQDTQVPAQTVEHLYTWLRDGGELVVTVPGEDGMRQMPDDWFQDRSLAADGETIDVPYMQPEIPYTDDEGRDGVTATVDGWGQYVLPRDTARELFETAGFSVEEEDTLTADASGIASVGRILGDRKMKWSGWLLNKVQHVHDGVGPGVDMYRLRK
ncbi:MAG: class I SAM-dependent methyltransferase [Candidatus Nanohaloarchaea archaeon]